jgi:hypothetical protein
MPNPSQSTNWHSWYPSSHVVVLEFRHVVVLEFRLLLCSQSINFYLDPAIAAQFFVLLCHTRSL